MSRATHCWQVDGAWRVGHFVIGWCYEQHYKAAMESREILSQHGLKLMQHYHTGRIEAVPVAWLRHYPQEEIDPT